jgi:hypothetical protein
MGAKTPKRIPFRSGAPERVLATGAENEMRGWADRGSEAMDARNIGQRSGDWAVLAVLARKVVDHIVSCGASGLKAVLESIAAHNVGGVAVAGADEILQRLRKRNGVVRVVYPSPL